MSLFLRTGGFLLIALLAGVMAGNLICSSVTLRNTLGRLCGRGALVALAQDIGSYQKDLARAEAELQDRGAESSEADMAKEAGHLSTVVATNLEAERVARRQAVGNGLVEREFDLLRFQFPPQAWLAALRANGLTPSLLRSTLAGQVRARAWIENEIRPALLIRTEECLAYYDAHPAASAQPPRLRASHIFFAAPPESSPEVVEEKRLAAQAIVSRWQAGETFQDLAVNSEDEASKKHGGDLNFFSEARMPSDFWAGLKSWPAGQTSGLIRTKLGFHVVELTDDRPVRRMPLSEVMTDIRARLENEKRSVAVIRLAEELSQHVQWNTAAERPRGLEKP